MAINIEDYHSRLEERRRNSICVTLVGFNHLTKRPNPREEDTFTWVVSQEIADFLATHNIPKFILRSSDNYEETEIYFPKDRADIAALFKLTFV